MHSLLSVHTQHGDHVLACMRSNWALTRGSVIKARSHRHSVQEEINNIRLGLKTFSHTLLDLRRARYGVNHGKEGDTMLAIMRTLRCSPQAHNTLSYFLSAPARPFTRPG